MADTRRTTFYLRGIALSVVLVNHFVNAYVSDNFVGYANGAVAVFFVLSGYGIFHSLQKEFARGRSIRAVLRFWYARALRIYPLYWLFLALSASQFGAALSPWVILGIPIEPAPKVGWFVTALIQCYLLAPFLYLLVTKLTLRTLMSVLLGCLVTAFIIGLLLSVHKLGVTSYRRFLFGHVFLFAFGMTVPILAPRVRPVWWGIALSTAAFATAVYWTRGVFDVARLVSPAFILAAAALCLVMISANPSRLPLSRFVVPIGTYSYSVFLFHIFFYAGLENAGLVAEGQPSSVLFTLLLMPLFILASILVERLSTKLTNRLLP